MTHAYSCKVFGATAIPTGGRDQTATFQGLKTNTPHTLTCDTLEFCTVARRLCVATHAQTPPPTGVAHVARLSGAHRHANPLDHPPPRPLTRAVAVDDVPDRAPEARLVEGRRQGKLMDVVVHLVREPPDEHLRVRLRVAEVKVGAE